MNYFKRVSLRAAAIALSLFALSNVSLVDGAVIYNTIGATYSQDFNTLITTGVNQTWTNDSTLTGWNLFRRLDSVSVNPPVAITAYNSGDGSVNLGSFYSFGTGTNTERALGAAASSATYFGSAASNAIAGWIAVGIENATGGAIESFTLGFDGEQWRNGGNNTAQTMALEYGYGASFASVSSWTAPGGNFNWASPVTATSPSAINGNVAGLVAGKGGTISNQNWNAGVTLWVRWIENNDSGNDHGMAIDNFTFSAIPEPSTVIFSSLALVGLAIVSIRKRNA